MKVLNRHPENNGWSIEQYCTGHGWDQNGKVPCGAQLEVADIDIQHRDHTDYGGGNDRYYGFTCPICGCFTEISTSKIPYNVRSLADKKPYIRPNVDYR